MKDNTAEVLQITRASALKAYNKGNDGTRKLLEELFPKQFGDITQLIKGWQDVFDLAGVDAKDYMETDDMDEDEAYERLGKRLRLVPKIFNGIDEATGKTWKPDWSNKQQPKWVPYMEYKVPSGFGLCNVNDCNAFASAGLGSRHSFFREKRLAEHAFQTFREDYNRYATM